MERKIGEIFEYNGEWYQCAKGKICSCVDCAFYSKVCCTSDFFSVFGKCKAGNRSDSNFVIFKKLEKVGEPFSCNYYGDARLVMMQEYQLFSVNVIYSYSMPLMYFTNYKHNRIAIEIKQNKEDMEENNLNLKPFDIQKAREGKPVCTRDGRKARIICFDKKGCKRIIALVQINNETEVLYDYYNDGSVFHSDSDNDLMIISEKKEGWVNVYKEDDSYTTSEEIYESKEEAIKHNPYEEAYLTTVKIEWEE